MKFKSLMATPGNQLTMQRRKNFFSSTWNKTSNEIHICFTMFVNRNKSFCTYVRSAPAIDVPVEIYKQRNHVLYSTRRSNYRMLSVPSKRICVLKISQRQTMF